jgi:hypothetical protein
MSETQALATSLESTASASASHAKTSRSLAPALASKVIAAAFGSSAFVSFGSFDRPSSSWKTWALWSTEDSILSSAAWPAHGTMRSGFAYELPTLELRTGGTASSSSRGNQPTDPKSAEARTIEMWPTPDANAFNDGQSIEAYQARKKRELAKKVNGNGGGTPLAMAVKLTWPTPTAGDRKGSGKRGPNANPGTSLSDAVGYLNPDWVEQLMGFMRGWTVSPRLQGAPKKSGKLREPRKAAPTVARGSGPSATRSVRNKPKSRASSYGTSSKKESQGG